MLIETLSTFPHMYDSVMGESMMKRAQEKGILEFRAHDLRDWTHDRHRTTDDDPYGGGAGLVMKCDPIFEAVEAILGKEFVEAKLASTTVEPGGDAGCPDRASSAANETAQWAVSQSEDCLSESRYRVAVPQEEPQLSLPNKLVANLPYAVAATVVLDYFENFPFLDSATVMVQKEVADRMAAAVGTKNYGAYTVKLGLHAEPAGRFPVGPGNFFPPPLVDSAVIRLNRRVPLMADGAPATPEVIAAAALVADAAFANRRKTIANSCKTYFSGRGSLLLGASGSSAGLRAVDGALSGGVGGAFVLDGADIVDHLPAIFDAAAIDPRRRGETLTQQEFLALGAALLKEATV